MKRTEFRQSILDDGRISGTLRKPQTSNYLKYQPCELITLQGNANYVSIIGLLKRNIY